MSTPETPPPGGDEPGRGLSGVQRAGIVLGALAVLLIVFVVLQGGDDSGSDSASTTSAQTTATQTTTTAETTSTGSTEDAGTTGDSGTTTAEPGDDDGSGGSGSGDDSGSETGTTEDQPAAPAVQTVRVVNGQPQGGVERLEFTKGDRVRFKVQSDVADEIHVHGYDIAKDVEKGGSVSFSFPGNIEGRFEIELENAGTQIAELEVKPS